MILLTRLKEVIFKGLLFWIRCSFVESIIYTLSVIILEPSLIHICQIRGVCAFFLTIILSLKIIGDSILKKISYDLKSVLV